MSRNSKRLGGAHVLVRAGRFKTSGVWFRPPWWREEDAYKEEKYCSKQEADEAFRALAELFTPKWCLSDDGFKHSLRGTFFMTGEGPFAGLVEIGRALAVVRQKGVIDKLAKRLLKPDEFEGAMWELEFQGQLIQRGCAILPWQQSKSGIKKRNFEFICSFKNQKINIEIKHLKLDTVLKRTFGDNNPYDLKPFGEGTPIEFDAVLSPLRRNHFKDVADKLEHVEGDNPTVFILAMPLPLVHEEVAAGISQMLKENTRLNKLSDVFMLHTCLTSSGGDCELRHVRSEVSTSKYVSKDFVDLMNRIFKSR